MDVKVERRQKNIMRSRLEEILVIQKDLNEKAETYLADTEPEEYRRFWQELIDKNNENIQVLSGYMVRKCNR